MTGIMIKHFSDDISEDTLKCIFQVFGDVIRYRIIKDEHDWRKRIGFITYENRDSAINAIQHFNGKNALGGTNLYVGFVKKNIGGQEAFGASNLFIKNLDNNIDHEGLKREFSIFGEIHSVKILKTIDNKSEGRAFVCYKTVEDATRAVIFMNKKKLGTKEIHIEFAKSANKSDKQSRTTYIKQLLNIETNSNQKNTIKSVPEAPAAAIATTSARAADEMLSKLMDKAFASTSTASNLTKKKKYNKSNNNLSKKENRKKPKRGVCKRTNPKVVSSYEEYLTKTIKGSQIQINNDSTTNSENDDDDDEDDDDDDDIDDADIKNNKNDGNNKKYQEKIGLFSGILETLPEDEQKKLLYELLFPQVERLYPNYGEKLLKMLIRLNVNELIKMFEDNTLMEARCSGIYNMMKLRTQSNLALNNK